MNELIRELVIQGVSEDEIIAELYQSEQNYNNADKTSGQTILSEAEISSIIKYELQRLYCRSKNTPLYAPNSCCHCSRNFWSRISYEQCKNELITGCPFCNWSFVE